MRDPRQLHESPPVDSSRFQGPVPAHLLPPAAAKPRKETTAVRQPPAPPPAAPVAEVKVPVPVERPASGFSSSDEGPLAEEEVRLLVRLGMLLRQFERRRGRAGAVCTGIDTAPAVHATAYEPPPSWLITSGTLHMEVEAETAEEAAEKALRDPPPEADGLASLIKIKHLRSRRVSYMDTISFLEDLGLLATVSEDL